MDKIDFTKSELGVLFVCLGNICRSPLARAVFHDKVKAANVAAAFRVDSCGTGGWHAGETAHVETAKVSQTFGVSLANHRARQLREDDLENFDLVVAMDRSNFRDIRRIAPQSSAELILLRDFDPNPDSKDVPDPWGCEREEFVRVHQIIDRSCGSLLEWLLAQRQSQR